MRLFHGQYTRTLHTQKKKSTGVISGKRGDQAVRPLRPVQSLGEVLYGKSLVMSHLVPKLHMAKTVVTQHKVLQACKDI